ncbi:hypothetical protein GCM10022222_60170 [Amycolatopsis ultiminotia]|uniref:AsnC family protein n=1 Tax=Amycolatopsis ultiminotia TaxID=543629 RepID=A0ABP6XLX7_9PSEU
MAVSDPADVRLLAALAELGKTAVHELAAKVGMDPREVAYRLVALSGSGLPLLVGVESDPNGLRAAIAGAAGTWQQPASAAAPGPGSGPPAGPMPGAAYPAGATPGLQSGQLPRSAPPHGPAPGTAQQSGQLPGPAPQPGAAYSAGATPGPQSGQMPGAAPQPGQMPQPGSRPGPQPVPGQGFAPAARSAPPGAMVPPPPPAGSPVHGGPSGPVQGVPSGPYGAPSGQYGVQGSASGSYGTPSGPHGAPSGPYGAPSGPYGAASGPYAVASDPVASTWGLPQTASWARGDEPRPQAPAGGQRGRIGETLAAQGLEGEQLTLQLLEVQDPADFLFGAAGYRLEDGERAVVVHTEITNRGAIPFASLPDNYLELITDDGAAVAKAPVSLTSRPPHKIGVRPGETLGGHTVYVLPEATQVVAVRWSPRPEPDDRTLTWTVTG